MAQATPYLFFDGTCREAVEFYAELFDAKLEDVMTYGDMVTEMGLDDSARDLVMHTSLDLGDGKIMASDAPYGHDTPQGMSVMMSFDTVERGKAVFDRLAEGGEVTMAFEPTFWSPGFGSVTDRFGTPWMIDCSAPA